MKFKTTKHYRAITFLSLYLRDFDNSVGRKPASGGKVNKCPQEDQYGVHSTQEKISWAGQKVHMVVSVK